MSIEAIEYSDTFEEFLDGLHDENRVTIIRNTLDEHAKGNVELDRRTCEHYENRDKAVICEANVVVYFDIKDDGRTLVMIDGSEVEPRAA